MATDKILHVLSGYAISVTFGVFLPWVGVVAGVVAAFGKEFVWDKWAKKGNFEWAGINVTLVGVLAGFCLTFLAEHL